jgi:hypothetical protein
MRVLVCGGRDYADQHKVDGYLTLLNRAHPFVELIEGGARGADELAGRWAIDHGIKHTRVLAEWGKYGKRAGVLRNQQMLDMNPDLVIAFPGGRGTAHMVSIAKAKGTKVIEVPR